MHYVYRFRLYPNREQKEFLNRQIGNCRFVYNKLLEIAKRDYEQEGKKWNYYEYKKLLPKLKEANSQSLQEAVKWLDRTFKNFFKGLSGFPKFKSKKRTNSISIPQHFRIEDNRVRIPKLKTPIRFIKHREIEGKIKSISITKTPTGKFYLNVLVEKEVRPLQRTNRVVAIDVGLTHFCTLSTGQKIENPKHLIRTEQRIKKLQKQLSKKKGSRRLEILARRIAKLHEKVRNQRNDFLHKLSKQIIGDNQAVVVEDLNVKGLVQNTKLSKHIADASWRRFIQFLEYKAKFYGRYLIKVDTFYPSSKLCHRCGFKKADLKLCEREWECPRCGAKHDRDYNATLNLLKEGLTHLKRVVGVDCPELMPVEGTFVPCEAGSPPIHEGRRSQLKVLYVVVHPLGAL